MFEALAPVGGQVTQLECSDKDLYTPKIKITARIIH